MGKPTRSVKNKPLGCKYLLLCVGFEIGSVYAITTGLAWKFLNFDVVFQDISFNNPSQFPGVF